MFSGMLAQKLDVWGGTSDGWWEQLVIWFRWRWLEICTRSCGKLKALFGKESNTARTSQLVLENLSDKFISVSRVRSGRL
jgi:hypothetical protein